MLPFPGCLHRETLEEAGRAPHPSSSGSLSPRQPGSSLRIDCWEGLAGQDLFVGDAGVALSVWILDLGGKGFG